MSHGMTSPTNHQSSHESDCPYNYGHNCCCLGKPDSQAGDELDKIFDAYDKSPEYLRSMTKAAVIAYTERRVTEARIDELDLVLPESAKVAGLSDDAKMGQLRSIDIGDYITDRIATLTKETEHHE